MSRVLHGDRVLVRVTGLDRKGRREGRSSRCWSTSTTVSSAASSSSTASPSWCRRTARSPGHPGAAGRQKSKFKSKAGQVVVVEIIEQPTKYSQPIGRIVEVLGNYADPGMEIEIALRKHDLPFEFPKALDETKELPDKVKKSEWEGREDLRDLPLVTIDGETARTSTMPYGPKKQGKGWRLVVAIADVSHYVRPGMALDKEAMTRGNSVYFPRRVIPMLPEKLSNGLCSLNPEVDRLAMVCDMIVTPTGSIKKYRFYPAVFHSKARLTYTQVWNWLSGVTQPEKGVQGPATAPAGALQPLSDARQGAYQARRDRLRDDRNDDALQRPGQDRQHRPGGAQRCASPDRGMHAGGQRLCLRLPAEHEQPCLYRIHEGPTPEKLESLRSFLKEFGLGLTGGDDPHARTMPRCSRRSSSVPTLQLLQTVMLRSLRQAMYSPDNVGHFGLAYGALHAFHLADSPLPGSAGPSFDQGRARRRTLQPGSWDDIGLNCSMTERRADEATRDVDNWLKCYYMKERIGEEFDGTIAAVVPFGVFVALDSVYVEGLVHDVGTGRGLFPVRQRQAPDARRAKRQALSPRRSPAREAGQGRSGKRPYRLRARRCSAWPGTSAGAADLSRRNFRADRRPRCRRHAVASRVFCRVERGIGCADQCRKIGVGSGCQCRDANTDGNMRGDIRMRMGQRQFPDAIADALGDRIGAVFQGSRHDDGELLATIACREISRTEKRRCNRTYDLAQAFVTLLVSVAVVEALEKSTSINASDSGYPSRWARSHSSRSRSSKVRRLAMPVKPSLSARFCGAICASFCSVMSRRVSTTAISLPWSS